MSNVKQPKCGQVVIYTPDGDERDPAFVVNQTDAPPSPTTAPADLLVQELDGTVTPRTAVAFSATPAANTWSWRSDE